MSILGGGGRRSVRGQLGVRRGQGYVQLTLAGADDLGEGRLAQASR